MKIVFSDIDGTLLNDNKEITPKTLYAINELQKNNIEFVIVSSRPNFGIMPILKKYNFNCNIICYGGGVIINKEGKVLFNQGFLKEEAKEIIDYIENENLDLVWNLYDIDKWICKDVQNEAIKREEFLINYFAKQGNINSFDGNLPINKILCMSKEENSDKYLQILKQRFPNYNIVKSSNILIEVMPKFNNKGIGVKRMCEYLNIDSSSSIAFGDNYNDVDMLDVVNQSFLMDNAPKELKEKYKNITLSNNNDGIYYALCKLNLINKK